VQGKEDKHDMAKTTRKTDPATAEKKPAVRRTRTAAPEAGARKATARGRKKTGAAGVPAAGVARRAEAAGAFEPAHDDIALRAWSIYERRGGGHGQALADWLEARAQLCLERGLKP
jgi:hypothetical protein